jgi:hypothetical protein
MGPIFHIWAQIFAIFMSSNFFWKALNINVPIAIIGDYDFQSLGTNFPIFGIYLHKILKIDISRIRGLF